MCCGRLAQIVSHLQHQLEDCLQRSLAACDSVSSDCCSQVVNETHSGKPEPNKQIGSNSATIIAPAVRLRNRKNPMRSQLCLGSPSRVQAHTKTAESRQAVNPDSLDRAVLVGHRRLTSVVLPETGFPVGGVAVLLCGGVAVLLHPLTALMNGVWGTSLDHKKPGLLVDSADLCAVDKQE